MQPNSVRSTAGQGALDPRAAPLRGTQSLVGVMVYVFKHPSLTGLELLWRWLAAAPLAYLAWHALAPVYAAIPLNSAALDSMTFMEPVRSAKVLAQQLGPFRSPLEATARWWLPLAVLVWTTAATAGRTAVLRRVDRALQPRWGAVGRATLARAVLYIVLLGVWALAMLQAIRLTVTHRIYAGQEPSLVLLTAAAVTITLVAFLVWSLGVWALDLYPLQLMSGGRLSAAGARQLRSKLVETNLVMGIVRVILLVLALTFSASPLPFQSRETQVFIDVWWVGVGLFYILSSDFFHVVRRVTYLRLLESIAEPSNVSAPSAS